MVVITVGVLVSLLLISPGPPNRLPRSTREDRSGWRHRKGEIKGKLKGNQQVYKGKKLKKAQQDLGEI